MSIELIAEVTPGGSNSVTISSIPDGYRQLLVIGSYGTPGANATTLSFGSGNASDSHYGTFNYGQSFSNEGTSSNSGYSVMAQYYPVTYTSTYTGLQSRPLIIKLQRYGDQLVAGETTNFTWMSAYPYYSNLGGAIEYGACVNQNQSGTNFTTMKFQLSGGVVFSDATKFSLYGYL